MRPRHAFVIVRPRTLAQPTLRRGSWRSLRGTACHRCESHWGGTASSNCICTRSSTKRFTFVARAIVATIYRFRSRHIPIHQPLMSRPCCYRRASIVAGSAVAQAENTRSSRRTQSCGTWMHTRRRRQRRSLPPTCRFFRHACCSSDASINTRVVARCRARCAPIPATDTTATRCVP